jgi:hypothetical protein
LTPAKFVCGDGLHGLRKKACLAAGFRKSIRQGLSKKLIPREAGWGPWSPTHSQKTRMDGARSVCGWLAVHTFRFLDGLLAAKSAG